MKLKTLTVAASGLGHAVELHPLHEGLNVVQVERESDARLVRHAVRQLLFGDSLVVSHELAQGTPAARTGLDRELFDAFFVIEAHPDNVSAQQTGRILKERLPALGGCSEWASEGAFLAWQREAETRRARYDALLVERKQLTHEEAAWRQELESRQTTYQQQVAAWEWECGRLEDQITGARAELSRVESQLDDTATQLQAVQQEWESKRHEVHYEPIQHPRSDRLGILYEYLDDLDIEWRRWRQTQGLIQQQRVRLRDEMNLWSDRPLTSEDHPFHAVHGLIQQIDQRTTAIEQAARPGPARSTAGSEAAADQSEPEAPTAALRRDLQALCDELGQQYRHIRHRAAVVELRQLRHHFQSISENIQSLQRRREQLIEQIRHIDPAGAQAIATAADDFMEFACQHGYLAARRKWVGLEPVSGEIQYRLVRPDLTACEHRLDLLREYHEQLRRRQSELAATTQPLSEHLAELRLRRPQPESPEWDARRARHAAIMQRIKSVTIELDALAPIVAEDQVRQPWRPNATLNHANAFLRRITADRIQALRPAPIGFTWELVNDRGEVLTWDRLDDGMRQRVLCCVRLAACYVLMQHGIQAPCVAECVLDGLPPEESEAWSGWLRDIAVAGLQIVLVTRHAAVRDSFHAGELEGCLRTFDLNTRRGTANVAALASLPHDPPVGQPIAPGDGRQTWRPGPVSDTWTPRYDGHSRLATIDLIDSVQIKPFLAAGIDTLGKLLELDPQKLPSPLLLSGVLPGQIDRWQAQACWLLALPGLLPRDARVLVSCGIITEDQLLAEPAAALAIRMRRYLESPDGRRLGAETTIYDEARVARWQAAVREAQAQGRWVQLAQASRTPLITAPTLAHRDEESIPEPTESGPTLPTGYELGRYFSHSRPRELRIGANFFQRTERAPQPLEPSEPKPGLAGAPRGHLAAELAAARSTARAGLNRADSPRPMGRLAAPVSSDESLKFYLDPNDPIEAAPSIGPKTAERFTAIGVNTIHDFLRLSADAIAERLAYKRISSSVVRQWQDQCRLVLQIPNLRGHDAQLLVACGITQPDQVASMSPRELLNKIGPFAETKEGIKIIRAGRKPDLSEVQDWIRWSQHSRTMQAA